jgi:CDP-diacylglycerol--glycerol-3-phosphate 3-phosphatidyltransferase
LEGINSDSNYRFITVGIIFIAFLSDILDGHIARKRKLISEFGKIIDPFADKIFVLIISIQLYFTNEILPVYFWIILSRDILIFVGGIIVSKINEQVLPSNLLGKITVTSIGLFFIYVIIGFSKVNIFYSILFYLSLVLSILSVIGYLLRAIEIVKWEKRDTIK